MTTIKKVRSVSLSKEATEIIDKYFGKYGDFSKWVEEQLFNNFCSDYERLIERKKTIIIELNKVDDELKHLKEVSKTEVEFMVSADERIKRNPIYLEGILNQYYNMFGQRVTRSYFLTRMKRLISLPKEEINN